MLFQVTISKMSRNLKSHIQIYKLYTNSRVSIYRPTTSLIIFHYKIHIFKYTNAQSILSLKRHLSNALCAAAVLDACIECKNCLFLTGTMAIALIKKGRLLKFQCGQSQHYHIKDVFNDGTISLVLNSRLAWWKLISWYYIT